MKSLLVVIALVGCAGEAPVSESSGPLAIEATPSAEIVRGNNTFSVAVAPRDRTTAIEVTTWMPSMGHGASVQPRVIADGEGGFRVENVVFPMPGTWQVRVHAICGATEGVKTFEYDVP
jgi:hypothetical protein